MIHFANSTFAQRLALLAKQPSVFLQPNRGIEREALRITPEGQLSAQAHPPELGSALTHQWITTDFAEQLLEFITPVSQSLPQTLQQLQDIHRFAVSKLHNEALWPLSMPCYVKSEDNIMLAQYGSSNLGKMKTLYRQGLKHRYGSMMQIIAGVHFNFSFNDGFWQAIYGEQSETERQAAVSDHYFAIIRNYYRFGWMIPYLFGASPAVCGSFINKTKTTLPFVPVNANEHSYYLPYATSLRLSDLGYTNSAQSGLDISFDSLAQYLAGVKTAIATPSAQFAKIGVKDANGYRQLNSNVLQIENELYAPIRPKRVPRSGEKPAQALARAGVQYIEVRSLDVNPYSAVGIDETQIRFLDLFLTWCALSDSAPMSNCELECWRQNWRKIVVEGRKPGLELQIGCHGEVLTQAKWGQRVFAELEQIAQVMDAAAGSNSYQQLCRQLSSWFTHPEKTLSARFLNDLLKQGDITKLGQQLASEHKRECEQGAYQAITLGEFEQETMASSLRQLQIEQQDNLSFEQYLAAYFNDPTQS